LGRWSTWRLSRCKEPHLVRFLQSSRFEDTQHGSHQLPPWSKTQTNETHL
jgi:hypothetical protein